MPAGNSPDLIDHFPFVLERKRISAAVHAVVRQRWEMFDLLSVNVLAFLTREYPQLGLRARSACRDLAMSTLGEQIAGIARMHRCYASILASRNLPDSDLTLQPSADVRSGDIEHIMKSGSSKCHATI